MRGVVAVDVAVTMAVCAVTSSVRRVRATMTAMAVTRRDAGGSQTTLAALEEHRGSGPIEGIVG